MEKEAPSSCPSGCPEMRSEPPKPKRRVWRVLRSAAIAGALGSLIALGVSDTGPVRTPQDRIRPGPGLVKRGPLLEGIVVGSPDPSCREDSLERRCMIQNLRRSNVRIVSDGVGAGIIIESSETRTMVLTAWHVPHGASAVKLQNEGRELEAKRIFLAPEGIDLAVIEVEGYLGPAIKRYMDEPWQGMDVIAIGSPLGADDITTFGHVVGFVRVNGRPAILTDAAINPGNSGGGLFDSQSGALVGIPVSKPMINPLVSAEGMAMVVPSSVLREFPLESWKAAEPPAGWREAEICK